MQCSCSKGQLFIKELCYLVSEMLSCLKILSCLKSIVTLSYANLH